MAFQKQIYTQMGVGKPGQISRNNPVTKLPKVVEDDNVYSGGFCFQGSSDEQIVGIKADATEALGLVIDTIYQAGQSTEMSMKVNVGHEVAVMKKGYAWVLPGSVVTKGDKVFVNPSTGAMSFAATAPEGSIDTGFAVETANTAASEVCEICNI